MKASASHTETPPRRRTGWSCAADTSLTDASSEAAWTLVVAVLLGFAAGALLVLAWQAVAGTSEPNGIRYSLPLDLFQDAPEVQCGDGKRVLNGYCVCSASCDSLQEAEI